MCSKIERWIYITRFAFHILKKHGYELIPKEQQKELKILQDPMELKREYYKYMKNVFGLLGEEIFLTEHEKIPYYA